MVAPSPAPPLPAFDDLATAFSYKTDAELRKSVFLYRSLQWPLLVRMGPVLVQWALTMRLPVRWALMDVFNQFCGGQTLNEVEQRVEVLARHGVNSTLDYAVEGQQTEAGFQQVENELLKLIQHALKHTHVAFVAMKLTGLGSPALLERMQLQHAGLVKLSDYEQKQWENLNRRLHRVAEAAAQAGQSLLIDAEETWMQDSIDALAEELMWQHNPTSQAATPPIYTTVQMYRHDRLAYLQNLIARAQADGIRIGVKLVRGAYLEKENQQAQRRGVPTPMQPSKAQTDAHYDEALELCLNHHTHVALVAGTHNELSCRRLAEGCARRGIAPGHPHVYASQLYGMSDNLSFNLAAAGYAVAKYMPYGPLEAVMPYLFRRAQENSSVAGQTGRELQLLEAELRRRQRPALPAAAGV